MIQAKVNNFMRPFYLRLIEDVLFENKFCLGLYTVSDFMKMSQTCTTSYNLIVKNKIIKRLVRYGNLDEALRMPFWRKLSPFYHMQESLKD